MHVRLSEEQVDLVRLADQLADDLATRTEEEGWAALAQAGLCSLRSSGQDGRPVGSAVETMLVTERLAARCVPVPFVGQAVLAPDLMRLAGLTLAEQGAQTARLAICLDATLKSGPADLFTGAAEQTPPLAWDCAGAEQALALYDGELVTVELGSELGGADFSRSLRVADAGRRSLLPGTSRLGSQAIDRWTALALAMLAADLVGAMDGALTLALDHVRRREQFGHPIGSFQAVQHLLADVKVTVEAARSATWHAAWAVDSAPTTVALLAARTANAYSSLHAREVVESVIQVLGGIGMTWEHQAHRYLRRVMLSSLAMGDANDQLDAIAALRLDSHPSPVADTTMVSGAADPAGGMDYRDSEDEAAFRQELRTWLANNTKPVPENATDEERSQLLGEWHRSLYEAGWMGLSWPTDGGGRAMPPIYEAILNDEVGAADALPVPHVGYLGRALMLFGSDHQRDTLLRRLLSGEDVWCQGFSETEAGSDLASLRTKARLQPDGRWAIDGQKIWTSDASWADKCLVLARTDADAPKHKGISAFVVPMSAPGVQVRPLILANGDREFNEVFFDDVVVDADAIIGLPGHGWALAMATVSFERGPADIGFASRYAALRQRLEQSMLSHQLPDDQATRRMVAQAFLSTEVLRLHVLRSLSARIEGQSPGPEGSIDKLLGTRTEQELHHIAMDLSGATALIGADPVVLREYLYSRAQSIAGGTSQIQRTIVAERVLRLPRHRS